MPVTEVSEEYRRGVDATFALLFGEVVFRKFHEEEKHMHSKVERDWECNGRGYERSLHYVLPPNNLIRMPAITVRAFETAVKDKNTWIVEGNAVNEGSALAEATKCCAKYVITQGEHSTLVQCTVTYSFELSSIPWLLKKTVETVLNREMKEGHRRFLLSAKQCDNEGVPILPPLPLLKSEKIEYTSPTAASVSSAEGSAHHSFYTPIATPTTQPAGTPLGVEIHELDSWNDRLDKIEKADVQPLASRHTHHHRERERDHTAVSISTPPQVAVSHTSRASVARYKRLILLVLALSVSWCIGHLTALPPPPPPT